MGEVRIEGLGADKIGLGVTAVTAVGVAAHAIARAIKGKPDADEEK